MHLYDSEISGPTLPESPYFDALEPLNPFLESSGADSLGLAQLMFQPFAAELSSPPSSRQKATTRSEAISLRSPALTVLGARPMSGQQSSTDPSYSPPGEVSELERRSSGAPEKARERNKKAQRTFRQRQKVCAGESRPDLL